jgi:hypothetical protein
VNCVYFRWREVTQEPDVSLATGFFAESIGTQSLHGVGIIVFGGAWVSVTTSKVSLSSSGAKRYRTAFRHSTPSSYFARSYSGVCARAALIANLMDGSVSVLCLIVM